MTSARIAMITSLSNKVDVTNYESTVKAVVNRLLLSRRISQYSTERDDLYQIGWMAVMNCAKTFDENRGVKFETYASRAIINAVNKELKRLSDRRAYTITIDLATTEIPVVADTIMRQLIDTVETSGKFSRVERKVFWLKFIDDLCFTEIGKQVGVSRETVRKMYRKSIAKVKELMTDEF